MRTTSPPPDAASPEEEALFQEFQTYVRSIYLAANDGAIQGLREAVDRLKREATTAVEGLRDATGGLDARVKSLGETVERSRDGYREMFAPAILEFKQATAKTLADVERHQNALAKERAEQMRGSHQEYRDTSLGLIRDGMRDVPTSIVQAARSEFDKIDRTVDSRLTRLDARIEKVDAALGQSIRDETKAVRNEIESTGKDTRQAATELEKTLRAEIALVKEALEWLKGQGLRHMKESSATVAHSTESISAVMLRHHRAGVQEVNEETAKHHGRNMSETRAIIAALRESLDERSKAEGERRRKAAKLVAWGFALLFVLQAGTLAWLFVKR